MASESSSLSVRSASDKTPVARDFLDRLTPKEAGKCVVIVGGGPAGLIVAELIHALDAQVPERERRTVLVFDRNQVLSGLGSFGIPPVSKQEKLKEIVVSQAQSVSQGQAVNGRGEQDCRLVGRSQWGRASQERFLNVTQSRYFRAFLETNVDGDMAKKIEELGIPLVVATGAQHPRLHTDSGRNPLAGYGLNNVVLATSEFFKKIGTNWLTEKKGVQHLVYDGKEFDLSAKKNIWVVGGGNVASDAFMWALRNAEADAVIHLAYRGPLDAMSNMARSYLKPIGKALGVTRTAAALIGEHAELNCPMFKEEMLQVSPIFQKIFLARLTNFYHMYSGIELASALEKVSDADLRFVLAMLIQTDRTLARQLEDVVERRALRLDFHPLYLTALDTPEHLSEQETQALNRIMLEYLFPKSIKKRFRANMFGLLTVEHHLDKDGDQAVDHMVLRVQKIGDVKLDRKGEPVPLKYKVTKRAEVMIHPYTYEKIYDYRYASSDLTLEVEADLVIEAIGDTVEALGDIPMNEWATAFEGDEETGRVAGRLVWIAGQALTQIGAVRDSFVSAEHTVCDMIPFLFPNAAERLQAQFDAIVYKPYDEVEGEPRINWGYRRPPRTIQFWTTEGATHSTSKDGPDA